MATDGLSGLVKSVFRAPVGVCQALHRPHRRGRAHTAGKSDSVERSLEKDRPMAEWSQPISANEPPFPITLATFRMDVLNPTGFRGGLLA